VLLASFIRRVVLQYGRFHKMAGARHSNHDLSASSLKIEPPSRRRKSIVKALGLLPPHFKLIISGGVHPVGNNFQYINEIFDEVVSRNLQARVHYTGYLSEQDLEHFAFKADLIVLPYDLK
jgi:glycosyltransferase involved in cell wall biosynthesis